jgi:hypothetical protein
MGMRVRVEFRRLTDEITLPYFVPADGEDGHETAGR